MYKENINNIAFRLVYPDFFPVAEFEKKAITFFLFFLEQAYYFSMYVGKANTCGP